MDMPTSFYGVLEKIIHGDHILGENRIASLRARTSAGTGVHSFR